MMQKLVFITLTAIIFCACDIGKEFELDTSFNINCDEVYTNSSNNLKIQLEDVVNDSRCPREAKCIWAGNAEVKLAFTSGDESENIVLNTNIDPKDHKAFGYSITLKKLSPSKSTTNPIEKKDYAATIVISKIK